MSSLNKANPTNKVPDGIASIIIILYKKRVHQVGNCGLWRYCATLDWPPCHGRSTVAVVKALHVSNSIVISVFQWVAKWWPFTCQEPGCTDGGIRHVCKRGPSCIFSWVAIVRQQNPVLAICHVTGQHYSLLDTIERHLQQAVNAIQEWATGNGFKFAAHKCKVVHFIAPRTRVQRPPNIRIGNTPLPVEESTKFLGLWWDSHLSFKKYIRALKTVQESPQPHPNGRTLEVGRGTLLMLYRAIVRTKLDYGCIVYGTASNTDLQLDSIHNAGVRLALGPFCTSPVSSMYTEANEAPLEERRLKLSIHYYLKTCACTDNPAHHALHKFDPTIRDLYLPRPNGRGGMTRPSTQPIGLKLEEAMTSAEIDVGLVCPLRTPCFPPGTHEYDPKKHIEGVSKYMITREEAQAKFREYHDVTRTTRRSLHWWI